LLNSSANSLAAKRRAASEINTWIKASCSAANFYSNLIDRFYKTWYPIVEHKIPFSSSHADL
jgi:hypothetical protein